MSCTIHISCSVFCARCDNNAATAVCADDTNDNSANNHARHRQHNHHACAHNTRADDGQTDTDRIAAVNDVVDFNDDDNDDDNNDNNTCKFHCYGGDAKTNACGGNHAATNDHDRRDDDASWHRVV